MEEPDRGGSSAIVGWCAPPFGLKPIRLDLQRYGRNWPAGQSDRLPGEVVLIRIEAVSIQLVVASHREQPRIEPPGRLYVIPLPDVASDAMHEVQRRVLKLPEDFK